MGLFDKILSDVVNGAVDSLTDKIGEKMFKSKQEPIKKEYNEDIDGKECTEIMESENVIPKFDNPEWVQVRNDLIFYDMWEEYIGFNKDIPDKTRIRKFVIWEYGGSLCLLYSDSYILFKLDKFVDKYNINNEKYHMDEKVYSYLSDRDNFMNFFDGIKSDIVNKAKADQIFVDEYEPSDEIIDKYIDLQASFDKLYNSLIY